MKFIRLILLLAAVLALLNSCDMSRWYFRHGGRLAHTKTPAARQVTNAAKVVSEAPQQDTGNEPESIETSTPALTAVAPDPGSVDTHLKTPVVAHRQPVVEPTDTKREAGRSDDTKTDTATTSMRADGAGYLILAIVLSLAMIVIFSLTVFLIAWVFAPVAVALRIALWTALGIFVCMLLLIWLLSSFV